MTVTTAQRADPLRTYHFRISVSRGNGTGTVRGNDPKVVVAGVQKVSGLTVAVTARETWEGGNALHRYANPDRTTWEPIRLYQGIALDSTLEDRAKAVLAFMRTGTVGQLSVKRDVLIEMLDFRLPNSASPSRSYLVHNAWISRYEAVPALDALSNEVALLSVELTHEGWERQDLPATRATEPNPATLPGAGDLIPTGQTLPA
jgi:phage tail-like protein